MFIKQDLETNYTNIILKVLKASLGVRIKLTPSRFDGSLSLLNMKCSLISWASQISLHLPERSFKGLKFSQMDWLAVASTKLNYFQISTLT